MKIQIRNTSRTATLATMWHLAPLAVPMATLKCIVHGARPGPRFGRPQSLSVKRRPLREDAARPQHRARESIGEFAVFAFNCFWTFTKGILT